MANVEEALYYELTNDATVSGLVSTRVYPLIAPQDAARPFIVYQRISTIRQHSQSGPDSLARARLQVTCVDDDYDDLRTLVNAVRSALDGNVGTWGSGATAVTVGQAELDNEFDGYEEDIPAFSSRQDFMVWHTET